MNICMASILGLIAMELSAWTEAYESGTKKEKYNSLIPHFGLITTWIVRRSQ